MTDAPKAKSSKAGPSGDAGENKPRFEVKKVRRGIIEHGKNLYANGVLSGTPLHSGHGISSSITVPSAAITSWTCASTARPIKHRRHPRNAPLPGGSAT